MLKKFSDLVSSRPRLLRAFLQGGPVPQVPEGGMLHPEARRIWIKKKNALLRCSGILVIMPDDFI